MSGRGSGNRSPFPLNLHISPSPSEPLGNLLVRDYFTFQENPKGVNYLQRNTTTLVFLQDPWTEAVKNWFFRHVRILACPTTLSCQWNIRKWLTRCSTTKTIKAITWNKTSRHNCKKCLKSILSVRKISKSSFVESISRHVSQRKGKDFTLFVNRCAAKFSETVPTFSGIHFFFSFWWQFAIYE